MHVQYKNGSKSIHFLTYSLNEHSICWSISKRRAVIPSCRHAKWRWSENVFVVNAIMVQKHLKARESDNHRCFRCEVFLASKVT